MLITISQIHSLRLRCDLLQAVQSFKLRHYYDIRYTLSVINCEWFSLSTSESKPWTLGDIEGFYLIESTSLRRWAVLFIIRQAYPRREGNSNSTNVSFDDFCLKEQPLCVKFYGRFFTMVQLVMTFREARFLFRLTSFIKHEHNRTNIRASAGVDINQACGRSPPESTFIGFAPTLRYNNEMQR